MFDSISPSQYSLLTWLKVDCIQLKYTFFLQIETSLFFHLFQSLHSSQLDGDRTSWYFTFDWIYSNERRFLE